MQDLGGNQPGARLTLRVMKNSSAAQRSSRMRPPTSIEDRSWRPYAQKAISWVTHIMVMPFPGQAHHHIRAPRFISGSGAKSARRTTSPSDHRQRAGDGPRVAAAAEEADRGTYCPCMGHEAHAVSILRRMPSFVALKHLDLGDREVLGHRQVKQLEVLEPCPRGCWLGQGWSPG